MGLINWFKKNLKLEQPEEVSGRFIPGEISGGFFNAAVESFRAHIYRYPPSYFLHHGPRQIGVNTRSDGLPFPSYEVKLTYWMQRGN